MSLNEAMNGTGGYTEAADIVFGVLELVCSVWGVLGNSLTVKYFYSRKNSPTYFLYLAIGKYLFVLSFTRLITAKDRMGRLQIKVNVIGLSMEYFDSRS